jgi:hypothetical protein
MSCNADSGRRLWAEVVFAPLATSLLIGMLGWWPTAQLAGRGGLEAMLLALALLLVIVYRTFLPMLRRMAEAGNAERLRMGLLAGWQRFVAILLVTAAIAWFEPVDRTAFVVWIGAGYAIVTLAETIALVRWMRKTEIRACT